MITRLKLSTIEQGLPKYRSMLAGNDAYVPSSYESIASATGTGSSSTITFSSIPSTYTSLQIRGIARTDYAGYGDFLNFRFNGDTGSNYNTHNLRGDGSSVSASGFAITSNQLAFVSGDSATASIMGTFIIDIHNYANTSQNKTSRAINGMDENNVGGGFSRIYLASGLWRSTSAITSITINTNSGSNFTTSTQIALYGVKGA